MRLGLTSPWLQTRSLFGMNPDISQLNRAYPIDEYPAHTRHAAAIMHMIMNNLDPHVAQFPQELVTYGGNGQVFSNWAQVHCLPVNQFKFFFGECWNDLYATKPFCVQTVVLLCLGGSKGRVRKKLVLLSSLPACCTQS